MESKIEPLMNDGFDGEPARRVLQHIQTRRKNGDHVAGIYCGYAPIELIQAMGIVPAVLCAFSKVPIEAAESVLPANLCPLIKSSYGFIIEGTCPFYGLSEAVIAETTCDGKKKMFELISEIKPTFVMDLPQLPDDRAAKKNWKEMITRLQDFLETTFGCTVSDEELELSIQNANRKNRLVRKIYDYAAMIPPVINRQELYDVGYIAMPSNGEEIISLLEKLIDRLENRVSKGEHFGRADSPRVLVTGCPIGGDAMKVFRIIEDSGGVIVGLDACTGIKGFLGDFRENSGDPLDAIAERYLQIPCACMTPNSKRLKDISAMIEWFKPDVVIDFILQACHSYNVESYKVGQHVTENHGLPFLKIETDYSDGDTEQLRTRIEALFESI